MRVLSENAHAQVLLWVIAQSSTSFIIFPQLPSFPSVGRPSLSPKSFGPVKIYAQNYLQAPAE